MSAWPEAVYIIKQISKLLNLDKRVLKLQNRLYVFAKQTTKEGKIVPDLEEEYDFSNDSIWFVQDTNDPNEITAISVFSEQQGWSSFIRFATEAGNISYSGPTDSILSSANDVSGALTTIANYLKNTDISVPTATTSQKGIVQIGSNISIDTDGIISVPTASGATAGVTKLYSDSTGSNSDGTMTQAAIKTYVGNAAIGAYQATATTIPNLINEIRNFGARLGTFSLTSAYTLNSITLPTGRYNFEWISYNNNNGTLLLTPNEATNDSIGLYSIRYTNGQVAKLYSFKHPTGDATTAQVLSGKTFSNATGTGLTGQMANNGALSKTFTPSTSQQTYTIPAGYTTGGTVTCSAVDATKTLGSTNGAKVDMGGAYRYVDTRAVANNTRIDGTLDNAANLWNGYTAYGKNGTKYTGSMNYVANGTKYTFTPSASEQTYTIPAGYHRGSDTYVKCSAVNNTGTFVHSDRMFRYVNGTTVITPNTAKVDMGATNLNRYVNYEPAMTEALLDAWAHAYNDASFSIYKGTGHATKTLKVTTTTNEVDIIIFAGMRAASNSILLNYQLNINGTGRGAIQQTSDNVSSCIQIRANIPINTTSTIQLVETSGNTGSTTDYNRCAWMCIFATAANANQANKTIDLGVTVAWS